MQEAKKTSGNKSIFTPEKTVKFFIISVIGYTIAAMIIWPLLELIFSSITNSPYTWTVIDGIVEPFVFGIIFTIIEFLTWNFFNKKQ